MDIKELIYKQDYLFIEDLQEKTGLTRKGVVNREAFLRSKGIILARDFTANPSGKGARRVYSMADAEKLINCPRKEYPKNRKEVPGSRKRKKSVESLE